MANGDRSPKRRLLIGLLLPALALALADGALPGQVPSDAKYGVEVRHDVMVPMRDGVKLSTDVYLPTAGGAVVGDKLPTILERTPYDKQRAGDTDIGRYFASHGYAVVLQDTRGRFKSEGVWHMLNDDGTDGSDTCIGVLYVRDAASAPETSHVIADSIGPAR